MRPIAFSKILAFAALAITASACGGARGGLSSTAAPQTSSGTTHVFGSPSATDPTATPTPLPTATSAPAVSGTEPVMTFQVAAVGYTATTYTVRANQVLKVRFTPGEQNAPVAGTGYYAQYSALGVYVTVGSSSQPTTLLSNGLTSAAQSSDVLDFSTAFSKTCASGDSTCRQSVTITVEKPNYDYWCYNYQMYCPWTHVQSNHPWNGKLEVETDDTHVLQ